ncbi:MAG: sugar nucleotide-binding protein [Pseudomonadales bacterium]|jgi:dTDP-4-dehydrorhamnose reductase|nr:sugar nucleotide-binding protein [Pseudomonadales bacterium]MBL6815956.1 sugar nucleotide-binding protein [Pseudomonadales bacterium]
MRLFIAGANSPTGKDLIEILRRRKIRFMAPPDKHFDPDNGVAIAKMVTDYAPTQLINLTDFISGNHSALKRAESAVDRCHKVNAELPGTLAEICNHLNVPMLHLSTPYVFDGGKRLAYNESDDTNPRGVYGLSSLAGEQAVRQHNAHIILRPGWLFGKWKRGLIKSWIRTAIKNRGEVQVTKRRFSPTHTGDMAAAILAVARQVDCEANVWGTYHYSGLETKEEAEFAELTLKYAANYDEEIYQLLDTTRFIEREARAPEIRNSTMSSKKIFDTFGIKQKSWRGHLQDVVKLLYGDRGGYVKQTQDDGDSAETSAA